MNDMKTSSSMKNKAWLSTEKIQNEEKRFTIIRSFVTFLIVCSIKHSMIVAKHCKVIVYFNKQ